MRTLLIALEKRLLHARGEGREWQVSVRLDGKAPRALAAAGGRVYCGSFGHGMWRSDDRGESWTDVGGETLGDARITAVAGRVENERQPAARDVIYCGTEPSAVWRLAEQEDDWRRLAGLDALPSSPTWSFPPRPETHHVRAIAIDPQLADRIYVCIEAGALVRSTDGGATWIDRTPDSPYDTHTLATHPRDHGRLYSAAGDGFFESRDHGETWERPREGLSCHYMWSVIAHAHEPELRVVTAAPGPRQAHDAARAESYVFRRTRFSEWERCYAGLPESHGTTAPVLAHDPDDVDSFWLACNQGLYVSRDAGEGWAEVELGLERALADELARERVKALLVV
jgi:hypothetical protein